VKNVNTFHGGGEGDVAGLLREVDGWVATLTATLRDAEEQRAEGADPSGRVVAKVSGSGRLLGLTIDPRAMRDLDHVAMAEAATQAIDAARVASADHLAEALGELEGAPLSAEAGRDPLEPYIRTLLQEG
jgi:DNA-binding protein YbaB